MQAYSDPKRASDPYSLPDVEVFQLSASEVAAMDEDLVWEYMKRPQFKLASMNSKVCESMLDAMVEEEGIEGGWFWWSCFPGCMPDGPASGPFKTHAEALAEAQENAEEYAEPMDEDEPDEEDEEESEEE